MKKLPVGIDEFRKLREKDYYYTDKTLLVKELMKREYEVTLFTRPRRFGKTLNMTMLKSFFEIGTDPQLFEGLAIAADKEFCDKNLGKYPVIFLSLKNVEGKTFEMAMSSFKGCISALAEQFELILYDNDFSQMIITDLNKIAVNSVFNYMLLNNGLSLTDHYWICKIDDVAVNWKEINLYTNPFKASYSLDLDKSENIAGKTNFTPSSSLAGDLKKKWIIDQNGIRRLVKGNHSNVSCRPSLCEKLASKIHTMQIKSHVDYNLIRISSGDREITGCECACFVDENTEFIPAISVIENEQKPNNMSIYEFYLAKCLENGLDLRQDLEYQIMTDFIISNTDRHMNNFGIIRDSKTLKWLHMAPIFDSGNSMFYDSMSIPSGNELLKIRVNSFANKETKLLSYVQNRGLVDTSKLPSGDWVYNLLQKDELIKEETNERLVRAYLQKIKYLEDFQNGADLASYNYVKSMNLF